MTIYRNFKIAGISLAALAAGFLTAPALADIVHTDDVIISDDTAGHLCVGSDCVDMMPFMANIQIKTTEPAADILLEVVDGMGMPLAKWGIIASTGDINFTDILSGTTPFEISKGAPTASLFINPIGSVGFGTFTPDGNVDIEGGAFDSTFLISNDTAKWEFKNKAANGRLIFKNLVAGGVPFKMGPSAVNGLLSVGTSMTDLVNIKGDLDVTGTLTTGGPTCGGGCDAVFDANYDLPSIEDHAAQMYANSYLPEIGPTVPRAPVNLSEQYGKVINELEKAHIYIAQQETRLNQQSAELTLIKQQIALLMNP
jgi:hypothetical protein